MSGGACPEMRWILLAAALLAACAVPRTPEPKPTACAAAPDELRYGDWKYTGETLGGFPHGSGTKRYGNRSTDTGQFRCGQLTGEGVRATRDGEYVGEFKAGKRNGRGVMTYRDGTPLSGLWQNDEFIGALGLIRDPPDPGYGLAGGQAVPVGGMPNIALARNNVRSYLLRLRGPEGEEVRFELRERCCSFPSPDSPVGARGQLEVYTVSYEGLGKSIDLYLNPYQRGTLAPPVGFALQ